MSKRTLLAASALIAISALVTTPALASTTINDSINDAINVIDDIPYTSYDTDADITSAVIDYTSSSLKVTVNYRELQTYSLTLLAVDIDTDGDGNSNYMLAYTPDQSALIKDPDGSSINMGTPSVATKWGLPGSVSFSIASNMIGSPSSIRVSALSGFTYDADTLLTVDSVPDYSNAGIVWSPKINRQSVVVVAPAAPKATKATIKLSKSSQRYKKTPVKLTATESPKTKGTFWTYDGSKVLKKQTTSSGKITYKFSKKLKKGTHKIKVVFKPSDTKKWKSSTSKTVKLTVKK